MDTTFWHPFANMSAVRERALTIVRGDGALVWDDSGREYVDATAALWFCNIGHGRTELADAAARQMRELAAYHTFGPFTNPPAEELARRVAGLAPLEDAKIFFTAGGGSDAIDTAGKLARAYWHVSGRPEKRVIVSRNLAYHGVNAYGTSLGGIPANEALFGRLVSDVEQVPWDDADAARGDRRAPRRRDASPPSSASPSSVREACCRRRPATSTASPRSAARTTCCSSPTR